MTLSFTTPLICFKKSEGPKQPYKLSERNVMEIPEKERELKELINQDFGYEFRKRCKKKERECYTIYYRQAV